MWSLIKKYGWRLAGIHFWLHIIFFLLGIDNIIVTVESYLIKNTATFLSSLGTSPVNEHYLPIIVKWGVFLFITEFNPLLMLGFFLYIIVFPFSAIIYTCAQIKNLYNRFYLRLPNEKIEKNNEASNKAKKRKKFFPFPVLPANVFLLIGWLLVFGEAKSIASVIIGVVLSIILLLILLSRLFYSVKPIIEDNPLIFWLLNLPIKCVEHGNLLKEEDSFNKEQLNTKIHGIKFFKPIILGIRTWLGHKNTKNLTSFFVLGEFIASVGITGICAVFCWALISKSVDPINLDLLTCLHLSVTYFLPGLEKPMVPHLVVMPLWIGIGTSATSWILLVLYLTLAGNLINHKQTAYLQKLKEVREKYIKTSSEIVVREKKLNEHKTFVDKTVSDTKQLVSNN